MIQTPLIRLLEPAIGDPVMEERAYGAVTQDDLDVVPADGISPPLVVNMPGILDGFDHMTPIALVQCDRQPALGVDCDLNWTRKVQASYAISACLRSGNRDHGSTSATR
jgi:hypothetical protein